MIFGRFRDRFRSNGYWRERVYENLTPKPVRMDVEMFRAKKNGTFSSRVRVVLFSYNPLYRQTEVKRLKHFCRFRPRNTDPC